MIYYTDEEIKDILFALYSPEETYTERESELMCKVYKTVKETLCPKWEVPGKGIYPLNTCVLMTEDSNGEKHLSIGYHDCFNWDNWYYINGKKVKSKVVQFFELPKPLD